MQVWKREIEVRDTVDIQIQMKRWLWKVSESLQEQLRRWAHLQSHCQACSGGFGAMGGW